MNRNIFIHFFAKHCQADKWAKKKLFCILYNLCSTEDIRTISIQGKQENPMF